MTAETTHPAPPSPAPPPVPGVVAAPIWFGEIKNRYKSQCAHQFLLHFNINDYILDGTVVRTIRDFLVCAFREKFLIVTYSISRGLDFPAATQEDLKDLAQDRALKPLLAFREDEAAAASQAANRQDAREFRDLQARGRQALIQPPGEALPAIERAMRQNRKRVLVMVDFVEKLAPAGATDREHLMAIETFQRWAIDPDFADAGHMVLLFASEHAQVAPCVFGSNSGTVEIQLPLPSADDRRQFLQYLLGQEQLRDLPMPADQTIEKLAGNTVGFSLRDIMNLVRTSLASRQPLDESLILERKKDIIRLESHGLLQVVETRHGLEDIGGLEHVKDYLKEKIGHIRTYLDLNAEAAGSAENRAGLTRALSLVPRGVLFAGPPGTGKTILAEALAHGSGLNMVKLQDVRSMWVGESERNLTKVFDLLVALQPVLVFVDEIDQSIGSRGGPSGGGGGDVDKRLFAKILEFMGDGANRGKILWVAATNRPDFLDAAMLRRFDRVIPILPPDREERTLILASLASRLNLAYAPNVDFEGIAGRTEGLTGAGLEVVIRRSAELVGTHIGQAELELALADYKPNHHPELYDYQSLLALQASNFYSTMPRRLPDHLQRILDDCRASGTGAPLEEAVRELALRVRELG